MPLDGGLVLILLLRGVLGEELGLDICRNLDVLGELHLEGRGTTGEGAQDGGVAGVNLGHP